MPQPTPPSPERRYTVLLMFALVGSLGATWWGASALFAAGVEADIHGTAGGLSPVPLATVVIGTMAAVGSLCVLTWQLALFQQSRRQKPGRSKPER